MNDSDLEYIDEAGTSERLLLQCFIEQYEAMPELWDHRRSDYMDKFKRNHGYSNLLSTYRKIKPDATVGDVKKKLNTLRSNYRKELRKIESSKRSGASLDDVYRPTSWLFYSLQFLGFTERPTFITASQAQNVTQDGEDGNNHTEQAGDEEQRKETSSTTPRGFSSSSITGSSSELRKRTKKQSSFSKQNELLTLACNFLSNPNDGSEDDYLNMAKIWARKLKELEPTKRLHAEKAINDILYEAQIGTLSNKA